MYLSSIWAEYWIREKELLNLFRQSWFSVGLLEFAKITSPLIERINSIAEMAERAIMERKPVTTAKFIGGSIRRLRMEHGETQQQLGEFLGYGATTIANYESGFRLPNLETFLEIAVRYNAEIRDFIIPPAK